MLSKDTQPKTQPPAKKTLAELAQNLRESRRKGQAEKFQQFLTKYQPADQLPTDVTEQDLIVSEDTVIDANHSSEAYTYRNIFIQKG
ncbi:MAG: hypothetical protein K0S11_1528, partial [Gammaproteobacteria bacterium]|nr:hypothetical protein [Gammaproteobacteria bacterium]